MWVNRIYLPVQSILTFEDASSGAHELDEVAVEAESLSHQRELQNPPFSSS